MDDKLLERIETLPQTDDKSEPHIIKARMTRQRSHMAWDDDEDNVLIELISNHTTLEEIAVLLQRSEGAIKSRLRFESVKHQVEHIEINDNKSTKVRTKSLSKYRPEKNTPEYNLVHYWRNSLADMDIMGLNYNEMKNGKQFQLNVLEKGVLPYSEIAAFFLKAEDEIRKKNKWKKHKADDQDNIKINKLKVIIAPFIAVKRYEHGKKIGRNNMQSVAYPLWIVADLFRDGKLEIDEEKTLPWVERRCLTPNDDNTTYPLIGAIESVDTFYSKRKYDDEDKEHSWKALYHLSMDLLNDVTNNAFEALFDEQHYELKKQGTILPYSDTQGTSQYLLRTYDQYIYSENKKIPTLLKQFCRMSAKECVSDKSNEALYAMNMHHLGQMKGDYALSASQRLSLNYLDDPDENAIFTIHGPPGTGKTTLLETVIASLSVKHVLEGKNAPIIVACASNNLPVQNILDNLGKHKADEEGLYRRWLPNITTFGSYLCASSSVSDAESKHYYYRTKDKLLGKLGELYSTGNISSSTETYLQHFNAYYNTNISTLNECKDKLKKAIKDKHQQLVDILSSAKELYDINMLIHKEFENIDNLIGQIESLQQEIGSHKERITQYQKLEKEWLEFKLQDLKWLSFFSLLPPVKARIESKIKLFCHQHASFIMSPCSNSQTLDTLLATAMTDFKKIIQELEHKVVELEQLHAQYTTLNDKYQSLTQSLTIDRTSLNIYDYQDTSSLHTALDKNLRHELFYLSIHYWEASWLDQAEQLDTLRYDKQSRLEYWSIQAMLTPCFVSTFHSGPSFFSYMDKKKTFITANDFIDLLIVDEAAQTMPVHAAPMISTAKKALFVGDTKQLEPIFEMPESIDFANTKKFHLCKTPDDYDAMKAFGVLCSGNQETSHAYANLILLGQRIAKFYLHGETMPGVMLKEHRRCAKPIIAYCNELCYEGKLIGLTNEEPSPFPRMGYAHIKGQVDQIGKSKRNKQEATAIATWLAKHQQAIVNACGEPSIDKCVGLITPYRAQSEFLKEELARHNLYLDKVGTVHSLQGAEKPIVIFSPVYTDTLNNNRTNFFFAKSANMLNVVVSRAKRSFLVFGDMDILDPKAANKPLALLARHLFADEENEITDVPPVQFSNVANPEKIEQITQLARHREILTKSFPRSNNELVIVSPFLRKKAIEADNILQLIKNNAKEKRITIYTVPYMNKKCHSEFMEMKTLLESHGASVVFVRNVHSKILAIDDRAVVIGSFNWLSAARYDQRYINEEVSLLYTGASVKQVIEDSLLPVKKKVL